MLPAYDFGNNNKVSHIVRVKDIKIAEAVKLLEEAYKEVNLAFANEFAKFCENAGIDFVAMR